MAMLAHLVSCAEKREIKDYQGQQTSLATIVEELAASHDPTKKLSPIRRHGRKILLASP